MNDKSGWDRLANKEQAEAMKALVQNRRYPGSEGSEAVGFKDAKNTADDALEVWVKNK